MSRAPLEPRLYLDPKRKQWVIRDGQRFLRTGFPEHERERAEVKLRNYLEGELANLSTEQVYFIRAHNRIKIGRAMDVKRRMATLQASSPFRLRLLWSQDGGAEVETALHRRFKECRIHGEWFEIKGPLAEYLDGLGIR